MKRIFMQGVLGRILTLTFGMVVLLSTALFTPGCKKTEKVAPLAEEEATAAAVKLKQQMDLQLVEDGFVSPIGLVPIPDNTGRMVVIDQIGRLWVLDADGNRLPTPFIDLTSRMITLSPGFDERG